MNVYHTSNMRVEHPDTRHSRRFLDFGRGFYVTPLREQAEKYAERFRLRGDDAWLNVYELLPFAADVTVKRFTAYDEEWLDFVTACRRGESEAAYDVVEGGIANDKVFRTIDLYFSGDIGKTEALLRLAYEHPNHQVCFCSDRVIAQYLKFLTAEKL